jgi:hypothetical protein
VPDTVLLDFTVTDRSPQQAQGIATELGRQFLQLVSNLETPDGGARSPVKVTVLRAADVRALPVAPDHQKPSARRRCRPTARGWHRAGVGGPSHRPHPNRGAGRRNTRHGLLSRPVRHRRLRPRRGTRDEFHGVDPDRDAYRGAIGIPSENRGVEIQQQSSVEVAQVPPAQSLNLYQRHISVDANVHRRPGS